MAGVTAGLLGAMLILVTTWHATRQPRRPFDLAPAWRQAHHSPGTHRAGARRRGMYMTTTDRAVRTTTAAVAIGALLYLGTLIGQQVPGHATMVRTVTAAAVVPMAVDPARYEVAPLDDTARAWLYWEAPLTDPAGCLLYRWVGGEMSIICADGTEIGS